MDYTVSTVLKHKGFAVVTVRSEQPISSVARTLSQHRIGAAPVIDSQGHLVGIISERDIVRGFSEIGESALAVPAHHLMTREVLTCSLEEKLVDLMRVMTLQRVRHLPVLRDGALAGIVSIGDVVKQRLGELQNEVETLNDYLRSP